MFFVIGFCSESIDIREEMRFEVILRLLIRVGLAEWFVANNVTIMKAFFTSIGNLVNLLSAGSYTELVIDSTQADVIKDLGFGESLIMLILAALLAIIIIICGFFMIYTVYFRFLRLLIIVPMLANSEFVALLKQANTDSAKMAEVIGVSDAQLRFVTNSQSGMGLLKCGNVVIPFDNQIGKDTSLYKLYNTNIHERIAEQKARKMVDTL